MDRDLEEGDPREFTDAALDALAQNLSFTAEQAAWISHHVRNALAFLADPVPEKLAKMRFRLERLCVAASSLQDEQGRADLEKLVGEPSSEEKPAESFSSDKILATYFIIEALWPNSVQGWTPRDVFTYFEGAACRVKEWNKHAGCHYRVVEALAREVYEDLGEME